MGKFKIRYLVPKRLKSKTLYYWQPKACYKEFGFFTMRLPDEISEAIEEANRFNHELDLWRNGQITQGRKPGTVEWLSNEYQKDVSFTRLTSKTQSEYSRHLKTIEHWARGDIRANEVSRRAAKALYHSLMDKPRTAEAVMTVARVLFNFGKDIGEVKENPFTEMKIQKNPSRNVVWSKDEINTFIEASEAEGYPSIGLAVLMAAYLGQRQEDLLKMLWNQYNGNSFAIRQGKTKAFILVPCVKELQKALSKIKDKKSTHVIVSEETLKPYKKDNFKHLFIKIRRKAGLPEKLQFLDLRRTAAVRLAEAGCTDMEVAAITGHSIDTTKKILETYIPRNSVMAKNAIAKLESWKKK